MQPLPKTRIPAWVNPGMRLVRAESRPPRIISRQPATVEVIMFQRAKSSIFAKILPNLSVIEYTSIKLLSNYRATTRIV